MSMALVIYGYPAVHELSFTAAVLTISTSRMSDLRRKTQPSTSSWIPVEDPVISGDQVRHDGRSTFIAAEGAAATVDRSWQKRNTLAL